MSLYSDFMELYKKQKKEEALKAAQNTKNTSASSSNKNTSNKNTSSKASNNSSLLEEFLTLQAESDIIAPVSSNTTNRLTIGDIAPTKEDENKWYNSGLFEDGYDFGDVTKTILGIKDDTASFMDLTWNSAKRGYYNSRYGEESFKDMDGLASDKETYKKILEGEEYQFTPGNKFAEGVSGAFELIGQQARQYTNPMTLAAAGTAALGAVALGNAGPQALVPEEVVTVPGAALAGFKVGSAAANFQIEAGHAYNEMLEAGISEKTAKRVATIVGAGNAGLELLQVDELVDAYKVTSKSGLTKNFTGKILDELVARGVDVAKETAQEVAQEGVTIAGVQAGSKIDKGEWAYNADDVKNRLKDTAMSSALSFGMMNVPATAKNTVSIAKEVTSDQYKTEKKVADKVYEDLVAEAEKNGKVTNKEKTKIWDRVVRELEKGGISTDVIESLLDEEGYKAYETEKDNFFKNTKKAYNEALESEEAELKQLQEELDKLTDAPNTVGNNRLYDSIVSRMTELKENPQSNNLRAQLDSEVKRINEMHNELRTKVHDMVKGTKLEESYNELIRSQQKYEVDVSKYTDPNARKTIENILKSGKGDNSNHFHEYADWLAQISADKGMSFYLTDNEALKGTEHDFSKEGLITNGYKTADGIVLNMDSPKALNSTVGHEITHVLEQNTELYQTLQDTVFKYEIAKNGQEAFDKRLNDTIARYKGKDADAKAELTADLIGDYLFTDYDFAHNLSVENRNVFEKIYDEIKYLYKIATAGSAEARELEKVKKAFDDAYRANVKNTADSGVQHSLYSRPDFNAEEWSIVNRRKYSEFDNPKFDLDTDRKWMYANEKGSTVFAIYSKNDADDPTVLYGSHGKNATKDYEKVAAHLSGGRNAKRGRGTLDRLLASIESNEGNGSNGIANPKGAFSASEDVPISFKESGSNGRGDFGYGTENLQTTLTEYNSEASDDSGASFVTFSNDYAFYRNLMKEGDTGESDTQYSLSNLTFEDIDKLTDEELDKYFNEIGLGGFLELEVDDSILLDDDDFSIEDISEETKVEPEIIKILYRRKGLGDSHVEENHKAVMTQDRINQRIAEHGSTTADYARRYITRISPKDFIDMTVYERNMNRENFDNRVRGDLDSKMGEWDYEKALRDSEEPPYLSIDMSTGQIIGHNGRHRMRALEMAGIESVEIEVEFHDEDGYLIKYNSQTIPDMAISSQFDTAIETHISNIIPFNNAHRAEIGKYYGEKAQPNAAVKYSLSDSKIDDTYFDAVVNRDWETAERMVDEAAKKAGYTKAVYHGTDARFTVFDTDEESTAREEHAWMADYPDGTIFLAEDYEVADGYGNRVMPLYLDTTDVKVFEEPDMYAHRAMDDKYGYEVYNYPVIAVKGKDMTIYATLDNTLVKSSDTVTYGDGGEIIPLSERFKHDNQDIRYSLSDSNGREVSPAVAKRFGNSKAVDENGNLKVLYHGTPAGEFFIFDKTKGSVEGDFGSGFYFTDDPYDVENNYEGGGPDFENKVGRRADEIWGEEEDIEYEEAERRAREELYKGSHKFEVYLNVENPAIVGKTILFDPDSYYSQYDQEDYDSEDDYYADVEQFIADEIDNLIWEVERNVDVNNTDGIADVLWGAFNEGGVDPELLKKRLNSLYLEDSNGNLVANEVARQIIESLGYDGIIDPTVSTKWNMNMNAGTTHYIVFKPNQIKSVTNENPTDNPDIRYSLSENGKPKEFGDWNVYASDFGYKGDFAPVIRTPNRNVLPGERMSVGEMFPDEPDVSQAEYDNLTEVKDALEARMLEMSETGDFTDLETINEKWVEAKTRLAELETELSDTDRADSLTDADAPPEMDAPYYESEPTTLTKKATADIVRDVRASLGLNNTQMADAKDIIERYRSGEIQTRDQLVDALQDKFGTYTEKVVDERLAEVKRAIRTSRLSVSDTIKHGIADYVDVMRSNRGRILFAKNGLDVDEFYKAMQDDFPDYFNEYQEGVPENQFREIVRLANTPHVREESVTKDIADIEEAADLIINGIGDFKRNQDLELSNRESKQAFESLVRRGDRYAPMDDIGPVAVSKTETTTKPTVSKTETVAPVKPAAKTQQNPKVAQVLTKGSKKPKQGGIWSKFVSAVVDKGAVFEKVSLDSKNMEVQAKWNYALPSNTEARAQHFMENGNDKVKPLKSIMKEVNKSGKTEDFYTYLYHVHNIDRMTLDTRLDLPNLPVYGKTITADISRKKAAQLAKKNPEFKRWAQDIYNIQNYLLDESVRGNLISQETADHWRKKYPHHVPIARVDKNGLSVNVPLDTNKTGVNNPFKRATGGNSDIEPLFNTMAQRIEQTYRAIARNSFGVELKNTLGTTINAEKNITSADDLFDSFETHEEGLLKPGTAKNNPTFTVFENGKRVEFEITEDMYDALKPTNKILAARFKPLTAVSEVRRNLLTVWNPVFALYRNPIKDMQDVAVNSQHPVRTYANVPNAMFQIAFGGKYADEYHKNGGKSNTYFDSRNNTFKAENNWFKNTIGLPVKAIENAGEFIEEIPRLAEYIASRKDGRSVERSMLDAARVTTNFAAGGDFTKFLNSHGFTFLNASVQGAAQHVRNFRESAKRDGVMGVTKTLAKYVIAGVPAMIFNGLAWDDDEEYEELNDYVKQNYFVIAKTDEGKFIRIPKGRTTAVMHEVLEQMQNLVTGDDEVDFSTFFQLFLNNIAPNNPFENNILSPLIQAYNNNAWYEGDIVPSRLQDLPAEEQFDESTDSISKWLGEKMGWSPIKINYLLDQYSGGLGDVALPMLTPEAESGDDTFVGNLLAPWKKEITTDKVLNNKNPGDFYDLKDELEVKSNSKNATDEDKMKSLYMDTVSWEMGDLYAQKREIQSSDLSDSEKYEQVRELQEQINEIAKNATSVYNNVSIRGKYSEVGDKRFNLDDESGTWYEIKPKNSDGSDNWYYQMEQDVTKALGISYGEYWNNREEYNYAYEKPEQYTVAKAVGGYKSYRSYTSDLWDIKADKDENGKSINGSRKEKVIDYIDNMDADYGEKIILFKSEYPADDTYNVDIIDYLNSRDDISYKEMETILKYLEFNVDSNGNISW